MSIIDCVSQFYCDILRIIIIPYNLYFPDQLSVGGTVGIVILSLALAVVSCILIGIGVYLVYLKKRKQGAVQ
jgi:uncharacterized BrkB/YihY/UPF0761 family membrane protein